MNEQRDYAFRKKEQIGSMGGCGERKEEGGMIYIILYYIIK